MGWYACNYQTCKFHFAIKFAWYEMKTWSSQNKQNAVFLNRITQISTFSPFFPITFHAEGKRALPCNNPKDIRYFYGCCGWLLTALFSECFKPLIQKSKRNCSNGGISHCLGRMHQPFGLLCNQAERFSLKWFRGKWSSNIFLNFWGAPLQIPMFMYSSCTHVYSNMKYM